MFKLAVFDSFFGNQSSGDVKIGIYGNRRAGKTTFLYRIFKKWKDEGRIVESNQEFQDLIINYENDLKHSEEVHRTVVDQFDIRVSIKLANGPGIQRFVFSDIRGENAAQDIDGIYQNNIVPGRVRSIAEKCDVFIMMFNPTYSDAVDNDFHQHELARMVKVIDVLVAERKESLPRICFVQTHHDLVSKKPAHSSIAKEIREQFISQASLKIRNGLNLTKIHPSFLPLENKCYCVNSLPRNKDVDTSPQSVLDKVIELKTFVPKGPLLPIIFIIVCLILIVMVAIVALIAVYSRDPKWVRDLKAGRFSMEHLIEFRKYVGDHQSNGQAGELWNGLHLWLKNNPASNAKVIQEFKDTLDIDGNVDRIKKQVDASLMTRFEKAIKGNHEKRGSHDQLVSIFTDIIKSDDGVLMLEHNSKALEQAKNVCDYLVEAKENGYGVRVVIKNRISDNPIADVDWYYAIENNMKRPCTFPHGQIQKSYLKMNDNNQVDFVYSYKNDLKSHKVNLQVEKNALGLPEYITTNIPVNVSTFDETIQLSVIGLPSMILKEYYNGRIEKSIPVAVSPQRPAPLQGQQPDPVPPPPKKQVEYIDVELCWEESYWFLSTSKFCRIVRAGKLHSDCFLCTGDAIDVPANGIRPYLVVGGYSYDFNRISVIKSANVDLVCLDSQPAVSILGEFDLTNVEGELGNGQE